MRLTSLARPAILAVAVATASCGGDERPVRTGTPEQQVRATAADYLQALREGDGVGVCELYTSAARVLVARTSGQTCPRTMSRGKGVELPSRGQVDRAEVQVDGDQAIVQFAASDGPVGLVRRDGVWRVEAFGPLTEPAVAKAVKAPAGRAFPTSWPPTPPPSPTCATPTRRWSRVPVDRGRRRIRTVAVAGRSGERSARCPEYERSVSVRLRSASHGHP